MPDRLAHFVARLVATCGLAIAVAGCGDDELRPDWDQLTFPDDVEVSGPVEVPGGITNEFHKFAVVTSTAGHEPKALARQFRLELEADGWEISGRGDVRPGFFAGAPDSEDGGEVAPLRQLERHVHGYGGRIGDLIQFTPRAEHAVLVHLRGSVPEPG